MEDALVDILVDGVADIVGLDGYLDNSSVES